VSWCFVWINATRYWATLQDPPWILSSFRGTTNTLTKSRVFYLLCCLLKFFNILNKWWHVTDYWLSVSVEIESLTFSLHFSSFILTDLISTIEIFLSRISIFIGQHFVLRLNLIYSLSLVICLSTFLIALVFYVSWQSKNVNYNFKGKGVLTISSNS